MAQQANPKVNGQNEPCLAQETRLFVGLTKKSTRMSVIKC